MSEHSWADLPDDYQYPANPTEELLTVVKRAGYIEVSDEVLMDHRLIPDTRPPLPPKPWRTQLHWWWTKRVYRARTRLGEIVAGRSFDEDEW